MHKITNASRGANVTVEGESCWSHRYALSALFYLPVSSFNVLNKQVHIDLRARVYRMRFRQGCFEVAAVDSK